MKQTTLLNKYFLFFLLLVVALEAIFFYLGNLKIDIAQKKEEASLERLEKNLASLSLEAKAVSIFDGTEYKKIYGKNDEESLPIASIAKVMTVLISLNNHKAEDIINISLPAFRQEGDYIFYIEEKFNIIDLAKITLIVSSNDGAYALVEDIPDFKEQANLKARKLGALKANFINATGLDENALIAGAYASAEDVNLINLYALKAFKEIFKSTTMPEINLKSASMFDHSFKNTNIILDKIPNILFSKTGYTPLAGGNLAIVFKDKRGHEIAITVLGSTYAGRFSDMEKIVNELYNFNYGN